MQIMSETIVNLSQGSRLIPSLHGKRDCVHPATLTRWINQGRRDGRGVRIFLEAVRISGTFITSQQAIKRFLEAIAIPAGHPVATESSPPKIDSQILDAMEKARELGV